MVDLDLNIKVYQESEATLFKIPEVTRNELLMNIDDQKNGLHWNK